MRSESPVRQLVDDPRTLRAGATRAASAARRRADSHASSPEVRSLDRMVELRLRSRLLGVVDLLGEPASRPGIAGTVYDTAWLAGVPAEPGACVPRFPSALQWLVDHQRPDGSWGGEVCYQHDRILCTLAALAPIATFARGPRARASLAAGTRYLWQHGHHLAGEPVEPVAFELLLPTLVERAQRANVAVPPHLDIYAAKRAQKLRLLPADALYSLRTTAVHSLEFLGDQADPSALLRAQGPNGALGNSPAATAFFLSHSAHSEDPRALDYLEDCLSHAGGAMAPVLHPCETFELLWAAYHLHLAGVPAALLLSPEERTFLLQSLEGGGVSLAPTFPIPDADDTAVALLLLTDLGETVDVSVLESFATREGHFASFPHERHSSVGVNLHVLHALLRVPGYPGGSDAVHRLLDYLEGQRVGDLYWFDKWHISPYYATAHALCVLSELAEPQAGRVAPMMERSREWLRQTQNADGSWGFYGAPTAEETAYGLLGLACGDPAALTEVDRRHCAEAARYLREAVDADTPGAHLAYPPLWVDKCLYTPTLVVQATIEAACIAYRRVQRALVKGMGRAPRGAKGVKLAFAAAVQDRKGDSNGGAVRKPELA